MKRPFKSFLYKLAIKFYSWGHEYYLLKEEAERHKYLDQNATIDKTAEVFKQASIVNGLGDKSKIRVGGHSKILSELLLFGHGGEIVIGEYTFCGPGTKIWSAEKITIGNRVLISHNVNIHDNISHPLNSELRHKDFIHIFSKGYQKVNNLNEKPIVIEDDVWIGFNVTIMKGVHIGRGAIIGSNTIITKDVPTFAVVVGNPARIIRYTD